MNNKFVPKKCINKFVNYKMEKQKKHNRDIMLALLIVFFLFFFISYYALCKFNYSITYTRRQYVISIRKLFFSKETILSILFAITIYPFVHWINSIKAFGVLKVKTKQNKAIRHFMEHLNILFEFNSSLSIAVGLVDRNMATGIVLIILFYIVIRLFMKTFKDTYKANFNCNKYINEQRKKGFNIYKCTFCNFNTFNYRALFKDQCIVMKTNNIVNINKNEFSNMMDNMW